MRAAYLPPAALRDHVQAGYEDDVEGLRAAFQAQLRERYPELSGRDVTQFGEAWLGIVDSLHVELIYAEGRQFATRLKAMQRLLADSLAATLSQSASNLSSRRRLPP